MSNQLATNTNKPPNIIKYAINALLIFLMLFSFVITSKSIANFINLYQSLIYSFSCLSILVVCVFVKEVRKETLPFNLFDIAFLSFIILNFISWFWASQPALIWSKSFAYLQLYLIFKSIQILNSEIFIKRYFEYALILICISNCLIILYCFVTVMNKADGFYLMYNDLPIVLENIKGNGNYISSLLIMLLPFLIISNKKSLLLSILMAIQIGIILLFNSRGSAIALFALGIYLLHIYSSKIQIRKLLKSLVILVLVVLPMFYFIGDKSKYFDKYSIESPFEEQVNNERLKLWAISLKLAKQKPILGVGSGNWATDHLKFGSTNINRSFNSVQKYNHAHNVFIETISELGLLGIIAFAFLFVYACYEILKRGDFTLKIIFGGIICYTVLASFYGIAYITGKVLKPQIIILIVAFALIIRHSKFIINNNIFLSVLILMAIISTFWSFYQTSYNRQLLNIEYNINNKKYDLVINEIDEIYWKDVSEHLNYTPLKILQARAYKNKKEFKSAIEQYEIGIQSDPYYFRWYSELAQLHIKNKNIDEAEIAFQKHYELNKNNFNTNIWLANIAIRKKKPLSTINNYLSFYDEWLVPHKEKYYKEAIWNEHKNSNSIRYWRNYCKIEDRVLDIYAKTNQ